MELMLRTRIHELIVGCVLEEDKKKFHVTFRIWDAFLEGLRENDILLSCYNQQTFSLKYYFLIVKF
jgi:hypothetical protein